MATLLARDRTAGVDRDPDSKVSPGTSTTSVNTIPPLGAAIQAKRFWFQRAKSYDRNAVATQVRSAPYSHYPVGYRLTPE